MTKTSADSADFNSKNSPNLSLIVKSIDEKSLSWAKDLHDSGKIYVLYGALDGLSLSYSMYKYFFDVIFGPLGKSSSDIMHEWLESPGGIAAAAASSISLIVFAMLANHFKDDDSNKLKRYIAISWPYIRTGMKGLKNAYKGMRSTIQVLDVLSGQKLDSLIVPMGVALGVLSLVNRLASQYLITQRKKMMKNNVNILDKVLNANSLTSKKILKKRGRIARQSANTRRLLYLSATYGGIIDGLYLYVGVVTLCPLSFPLFVTMTAFCLLYVAVCVAIRIFEEYDYQRKLLITEAKIESALYSKEIDAFFAEHPDFIMNRGTAESKALDKQLNDLIKEYEKNRNKLQELTKFSYTMALFLGLRNGLAAYGAAASAMFAVGTILSLASVAFPPAFLITCICVGLALLIAFAAHTLMMAHKKQVKESNPTSDVTDIDLKIQAIKKEVKEINPQEKPLNFFPEWFENIRSFFSGMGKGSKAVDFTMNPMQERNDAGHYQDTPIMLGVTVVSSLLHALILTLRAHARGFGKPPIDAVAPKETQTGTSQTSPLGESEGSKLPDSPPAPRVTPSKPFFSTKQSNQLSFFKLKPPGKTRHLSTSAPIYHPHTLFQKPYDLSKSLDGLTKPLFPKEEPASIVYE